MKIATVDISAFSLPLSRRLTFKGLSMTERRGALLKFVSDDGHTGYGEVSPLEGFHRESLTDAVQQLKNLRRSLTDFEVCEPRALIDGDEHITDAESLYPSVLFAIEMAMMNLWSSAQKQPVRQLLSSDCSDEVKVNALLAGSPDEIRKRAESTGSDGYSVVKLKVGQGTIEEDASLVGEVKQQLPTGVRIRLDANRSWSFDEAMRFADLAGTESLEYIEEPLQDSSRLVEYGRESGFPVAIDETLLEIDPSALAEFDGIAAVVLKPTLLGGFRRSFEFIEAARRNSVTPVISATFDTDLTVLMLAEFSAAVCDPKTACGLDTLRLFSRSLLRKPLSVQRGYIRLGEIGADDRSIDTSLLREVNDE